MDDEKQEKLKILFIAKNIPLPGTRSNKIIFLIANKISSFCKVNILYPNIVVPFGAQFIKKHRSFYNLKKWNDEGFNVDVSQYFRLPFKKMAYWFWKNLSKKDIAFYKKTGPFDLIHAHYLFPDGYLGFLYSKKYHIPYVISIRIADVRYLKSISKNNPDYKKANTIIHNASRVLCLNYAHKEFIDNTFGLNTLILTHGIEKTAFYNKLKKPNNKVIITTIAEAIKLKNIDWIIRAFQNYSGKQDIELNIIGTGVLINDLKQLAGNDNRIHFHGILKRPEVLEHLKSSDIFALPSYPESFGLVYLEAAATMNAIIGFRNEGMWGIFEDKTEMLFSRNESDFQKQLYKLIDDYTLRSDLMNKVYKKAIQMNWDNIIHQYKKIYLESIHSFHTNSKDLT